MKDSKKMAVLFWGLWSSISVFSENGMLSDANIKMRENVPVEEYDFAPDEGSRGVEVAPLPVNSQDKNVPYFSEKKSNFGTDISQQEEQ